MATFYYQALDAHQAPVAGEIQADGVSGAIAQLEARGLTILSIANASSKLPSVSGMGPQVASAPLVDARLGQAVLRQHVERVIGQGKALAHALRAFAEEIPSSWRRQQLLEVVRLLERGDANEVTAGMQTLPEYWIPLLSAATASNDPGRVIHEFVEQSQRSEAIRRQWLRTLAYPFLIALIAGGVLVALSAFVIPIFRAIFMDFGLNLPKLTLFVLNVAHGIKSYPYHSVIGVMFVVLGLFWLFTHRRAGGVSGWLADHLPARFSRSTTLAQFSRFTADLLEGGLNSPSAISVVGLASRRLRRLAAHFVQQVHPGSGEPAVKRPLSATITHAMRAEMSTPSRIRLLREISDCYLERRNTWLSWTRGVAEPLAILAIGLVVGITVLALFVPLVSLLQGLSSSKQ
jgi:type II secretory pathway component PulF